MFPASIQSSLTDQLEEQTRLVSGSSIAASRRCQLGTHNTKLSPPPAIKKINKTKPKSISLVSLTDAGGGVDEIQDGGGE